MTSYADTVLPKRCTTAEALALFDSLESVAIDFMLGRWRGGEVSTGHSMDGLLELANWYGKEFISSECVHPLLFSDSSGEVFKVAPNAQAMKFALGLSIPQNDLVKATATFLTSLLKTEESQARLRMTEHRGQLSATMIYDHLPINDIFKKVDEHTVFGLMDYKASQQPFFFSLTRV